MTKKKITIRKYQKKDAVAVSKMVYDTVLVMTEKEPENWSHEYLDLWKTRTNEQTIEYMNSAPFQYVAFMGKKVVGMVRMKYLLKSDPADGQFHLNALYVTPAYHRTGVGKALFQKVEDRLQKENIQRIRVFSSMSAVPFYQSLGFKKTTGKKKHYGVWTQPMHKRYS